MPLRLTTYRPLMGVICLCLCVGGGAAAAASVAAPTRGRRPAASQALSARRGSCPFAHATPDRAGAHDLSAALRCLINHQRGRRGLARLVDARALDRKAQRFAMDMRPRGYFGHVSPDGWGPAERLRSARLRAIGEVLAWGCGRRSTPAGTVRAWLASRPHRRLVLSRAYTLMGAGVTAGAPGRQCGPAASTSVVILGRPH